MLREGETADEYMKRMEEKHERESNIWCPYCDTKQDEESKYEHVTYWGQPHKDEDELCYCDECEKKFRVKESVTRTFETEKIEDEH